MKWSDITSTNYEVSDTGLVRNKTTGKVLTFKNRAYPQVSLSIDGIVKDYYVHYLVATAFIPNTDNLPIVRHLDDNKRNPTAYNLAWGTYSDNAQDAIRNGVNYIGIPVIQYLGKVEIARHRSLADAAKAIGLKNPSHSGASLIKAVCEGSQHTSKGFVFKYAKEANNEVE